MIRKYLMLLLCTVLLLVSCTAKDIPEAEFVSADTVDAATATACESSPPEDKEESAEKFYTEQAENQTIVASPEPTASTSTASTPTSYSEENMGGTSTPSEDMSGDEDGGNTPPTVIPSPMPGPTPEPVFTPQPAQMPAPVATPVPVPITTPEPSHQAKTICSCGADLTDYSEQQIREHMKQHRLNGESHSYRTE